MPLRDHSLKMNTNLLTSISNMFIEETKPQPQPQPQPQSQSFCELLFEKYMECVKKTQKPFTHCQSEFEIIYTTQCFEIIKLERKEKVINIQNNDAQQFPSTPLDT